ncbi:MAG TPA: hypothetical protein VGR67_15490 [Candidatus Polarisedimenticolia bacterium]|jgi:N-acetylneuraminic acid mutarotase|nr:hypothetical protein [Candidatus Polarisedimenticolia bacterium]
MQLERHSLLFPLIRWLIGWLTALLLTLPALEGSGAASLNPPKEEASRRVLSFDARVAAQKAIEEVFWRHRIWPKENPGPKPALEEVLPDSVIRERVTEYLKKSNALEKLWGRPLIATQLHSEMGRMAKNSRQPEVLREVFAALRNDPFLIAECLARPILADRLFRNWYSFDDRVHGPLRAEAQQALARHRALSAEPPDGAGYHEVTWRSRPTGRDPGDFTAKGKEISLDPEEYETQVQSTWLEMGLDPAPAAQQRPANLAELPQGRFGPLQEDENSFFAKAVIAQDADSMRVGALSWRKTPFETWWSQERRSLDADLSPEEEDVQTVAVDSPTCADDTWTPIAFGPNARFLHAAVWTGSEMLIWGGEDVNSALLNSGLRYNPATDTWTPMNPLNAPTARIDHTAIWTGTRMIVWGGAGPGASFLNTGGRYDPSTDTWTATNSTAGIAPTVRMDHTAVWTGSEMIVWGGYGGARLNDGGRYDPSSDTWIGIFAGTGPPGRRRSHSAVWTGSEMIVWGGIDITELNTGGRYVPSTNTWSTTSTGVNLPSARFNHTAVWTGTQMIIFGGTAQAGDPIGGARYNPGSDTWSTLNTPLYSDVSHAAVWTGSRMIVWGGYSSSPPNPGPTNLGFRYDPSSDTYVTTNLTGAPASRDKHTGVWTGTEMIVWGGSGTTVFDSGGRYDPASDSWVPTSRAPSPTPRFNHSAIWTGSEMIVWGGAATGGNYVSTGGRYVPATDAWSATNSAPGAVPEGRTFQTEVWTGTEMIVWGGMDTFGTRLSSGGRYNPTSDSWFPTGAGTNLPVARVGHSAIWTGTEMIVWGGTNSSPSPVNSGGRYSPASDGWVPTGVGANLPSARSGHTATWTGNRMFVWGGSGSGTPETTGGRYDPGSDSWAAVSTSGAPSSPDGHTAVWTGSEVIVWGSSGPASNTGGRYNPSSNTWNPTGTGTGVPAGRLSHTAVWGNGEMIVWGGYSSPNALNTGGRYNPSNDTWTPTGTGSNLPYPRYDSRAVWAGTEMLVWGGFNQGPLGTGGRYCRQCGTYYIYYLDRDLDHFGDPQTAQTTCESIPLPGFVSVGGDCLDTDPQVWGVPSEVSGLAVLTGNPTTVTWTSQSTPAGSETIYDLVGGTFTSPPGSTGLSAASCLQPSGPNSFPDSRAAPAASTTYWYLARARNSCGIGTYGAGRDAAIPPCP